VVYRFVWLRARAGFFFFSNTPARVRPAPTTVDNP
jgi:hypothetical protein